MRSVNICVVSRRVVTMRFPIMCDFKYLFCQNVLYHYVVCRYVLWYCSKYISHVCFNYMCLHYVILNDLS